MSGFRLKDSQKETLAGYGFLLPNFTGFFVFLGVGGVVLWGGEFREVGHAFTAAFCGIWQF